MFGPELRHDLEAELARGYDVLHLEQLWTGWLGLRAPRAGPGQRPPPPVGSTWKTAGPRACARGSRSGGSGTRERPPAPPPVPLPQLLAEAGGQIRRVNPAAQVTTVPVGIDPAPICRSSPTTGGPAGPMVSVIGSMGWYPDPLGRRPVRDPSVAGDQAAQCRRRTLQVIGWGAKDRLARIPRTSRTSRSGEHPGHPPLLRADGRVAVRPGPGERHEDQDPGGPGLRRARGHHVARGWRACRPPTASTPACARTTRG